MFAQGQVVLEEKKFYGWHPEMFDGKPWFCPMDDVVISFKPGAKLDVAARVDDYTPIFKEEITLRPGLPALAVDINGNMKSALVAKAEDSQESSEGDWAFIDETDDEAPWRSWQAVDLNTGQGLEKKEWGDIAARTMLNSHFRSEMSQPVEPRSEMQKFRDIEDYQWTGAEWTRGRSGAPLRNLSLIHI